MSQNALNKFEQSVISDFFSPTINTEVIIGTLLSPFIAEIVQDQCQRDINGNLQLLAKELPMRSPDSPSLNGSKADFVLVDDKYVYVVELKTVDGSIDKDQAQRYFDRCGNGKKFGDVIGDMLVEIVHSQFKTAKAKGRGEAAARSLFDSILPNVPTGAAADAAFECIRENGWHRRKDHTSKKHLYTLGRIVDFLATGQALWDKELRLVYITPTGTLPSELYEDKKGAFYIAPPEMGSVSLLNAASLFRGRTDEDEMLARILETVCG